MKKTALLFLFICFSSFHLSSQNTKTVDSILKLIPNQKDSTLVKSYIQLTKIHLNKNDSLSIIYSEKAYNSATELDNSLLIAKSSLGYGIALMRNSKFTEAKGKMEQALGIYKANKNVRDIYHTISTIGFVETRIGNYEEAIKRHIEAITMAEKDPNVDLFDLGNYYLRISNTYGDYGKIETSNDYLKKAEKIFRTNDFTEMSIYTLSNIGINLNEIEKYNEAIPYFEKAIAYYEENNMDFDVAMDANNLGNSYFELGQLNKAKINYKKALRYSKGAENEWYITLTYKNIGLIEYAKKNYGNALFYYKKALINAEEYEKKDFLADTYRDIADAYAGNGDYKNAYTYNKKYNILNSEIFSEESDARINELEIKYQTEKKEQEILNQKNKIDLLNIKNKVNNQQLILLGLVLLLALIALYAIYQRSKRHKLEKEKAEADLEFKTKELTTHALHLAKKNEVLNDLKQKAKVLKQDTNADPGYQMLIQTINFDLQDDNNWENFSKYFEEVHKDFNSKAQQQFPKITTNDLRLMALLKMNLSSKEIANILNISSDGIKKARQRLRKKMGIASSESLEAIVIAI